MKFLVQEHLPLNIASQGSDSDDDVLVLRPMLLRFRCFGDG